MIVDIQTMAESLASVSDNEEGFKPDTAATIADRLRQIADERFGDEVELTIGAAREVQDQYLANLKAGVYGSGAADEWHAAEAKQVAATQEAADAEGLS